MKPLAVLVLALPFGGGQPPPKPVTFQTVNVLGLTLLVGDPKVSVGRHGVESTSPVEIGGGKGTLVAKLGLVRDVTVTIHDADAGQVTALFDLPAGIRTRLVGRIGSVVLTVKGDALTLTATGFRLRGDWLSRIEATGDLKKKTYTARIYAFGGLATVDGKLPGE